MFSTEMIVSNIIGGAITLVVALVVFGIQERRARRSFERTQRFLERRGKSAQQCGHHLFGTRVTPGTGELKVEGYAPRLVTRRQADE